MRQGHDFAIILAGGRGTRMQASADSHQKCLLNVHGKPFLGWLLELWSSVGVNRFVVIVNYDAKSVERFIASSIYSEQCSVVKTGGTTTASAMAEAVRELPSRFIFLHGNVLISALDAAAVLSADHDGSVSTLATVSSSSGLTHAVVEYCDSTHVRVICATSPVVPMHPLGDLSLGIGVLTRDALDWRKASLPGAMVESLIDNSDVRGFRVRDFRHVETMQDLAQLEHSDLSSFLWNSPVTHD